MPLAQEDCTYLQRQVQRLLQRYDPVAHETLTGRITDIQDPRHQLLVYLQQTRNFYAERSTQRYQEMLNRFSRNVHPEAGGVIQQITVTLSEEEQEIYEMPQGEINLADVQQLMPSFRNYESFITALNEIIKDIERETRAYEGA
ncbi:MAG TPA: hypothetical protein DCQ33_08070 [Nitrospira sp.]|nr:hypothetical protein [Nitrospira sp.]